MKLTMNTAVIALVLVFSVMMPSAEAGDVSINKKAKRMSVLDLLTNVNLERRHESTESNQPSKSSQTSESNELSELNHASESNHQSESSQPLELNQPSESNHQSESSQPLEQNQPSKLNQLSESNQQSGSSLSLQGRDSTEGIKTRHVLMKRWGRQMFGCHCSGFHIHCHSDSYCSARYGHGYKCKKSCCGMACGH